jgi:hypothetical protein
MATTPLINSGYVKEPAMLMSRLSLSFAFLGSACGVSEPMFDCVKTILLEVNSPKSAHKASLVEVACGATTQDMTWIMLSPNQGGKPERVGILRGRVSSLLWQGDDEIVIVTGEAQVINMNRNWGRVRIEVK